MQNGESFWSRMGTSKIEDIIGTVIAASIVYAIFVVAITLVLPFLVMDWIKYQQCLT